MHHAAFGEGRGLFVTKDRLVEHQAIFERAAHQLRIFDTRAVVAAGDRAAFEEDSEFRELFALATLADAAHRVNVAVAGARGEFANKNDRRRSIDRRIRVRRAGDRRKAAGDRGERSGRDRFRVFAARFAEVDVHVDQPRRDDFIGRVDFGGVFRRLRSGFGAERGDFAVDDQEVGDLVEVLRRVDDASVLNKKGVAHC